MSYFNRMSWVAYNRVFTIVATIVSFWLINKHLQWYTNKREQRYIIRLLLMVPIYSWISLASYLFWDNATPLLLIRDAYEASSSPLSFISCSRICPRTLKCRRPSFANVTPYMTAEDINIGWGAILETFEMSVFAFVHIKAFSYKPYRPLTANAEQTPRLRSFTHAMDFRETFREMYASLVYMWHRMRGVETDPHARRIAVLENVFDKSRPEKRRGGPRGANELVVQVDKTIEVAVAVDGEQQWLGVGDDYGYGLSRRERSEALVIQFEKELEKRGYGRSDLDPDDNLRRSLAHEHRHRSWKRRPYERIAQRDPTMKSPMWVVVAEMQITSQRNSSNAEKSVRVYDDQPPPSILRTYRNNRTASQTLPSGAKEPELPQIKVMPGLPMVDRYPLSPVNANIARSDTVLARLFSDQPLRSDGDHTSLSGGASVNVDARRPVEVATRRPGSPNTNGVQELHTEPTVHPVSAPPVRQRQVQLDRSDPELPPPPPPKDPRRSLHRREFAHIQPILAQIDVTSAPVMPAVPAPNPVSDPKRIVTSSRRGERSHYVGPSANVRELPVPRTPSSLSHRLPMPRIHTAAFSGDRAPSPRSRAYVKVGVPTHTFSPEPTHWLRSKGMPRTGGGMSPLPSRLSSFPLKLYSLPDARSPPIAPRADQTLLRYQDS
ncbi:organic solute transporter Ostalpha-domain-containing protein [Russula vinacea]|nr:organic solute transporter Ostalpha-domain-containing protein [Russula vinacea]